MWSTQVYIVFEIKDGDRSSNENKNINKKDNQNEAVENISIL